MNRVEELTLAWLDGRLSGEEAAELDRLLDGEDEARSLFVRLLDLEAALRGGGPIPEIAVSAMQQIEHGRRADLERSVMQTIAALPKPREPRRSRSWRAALLGLVVSVSLVIIALPFWWRGWQRTEGMLAVVMDTAGEVVLESPAGQVMAAPGQRMAVDQCLSTRTEESFALVQYADGTRLEVFGNSAVRLAAKDGKRVELLEGSLRADVPAQTSGPPLVVKTPHAEFRVRETRFDLSAQNDEGTRINMETGKVELVSLTAPATELISGETAFVPADLTAVIVEHPDNILTEPMRELKFPQMQRFHFGGDGSEIIGVTQRQSVHWQPEVDHLEAVRLGNQTWKSQSVAAAGGPVVALVAQPGRMQLWDTQRRAATFTGPSFEPGLPIAAVSPRGDWCAFWSEHKTAVRIWHVGAQAPVDAKFPGKLTAIAASPDATLLAVGRFEKEFVVNLVDAISGTSAGQVVARLPVGKKAPLSLAFSGDGKRLAVGMLGRLQLWDLDTRTLLVEIEQPACSIQRLAFSENGGSIAAAVQDGSVWVWNVARPKEPRRIRVGQPARWIAFAPQGEVLATLDRTDRLALWRLP